jgi:alpha-L-rhamnosidase
VPGHLRAAAAGHLVAAIRAADWHLTTGFVGVGYLLPALSSAGFGRLLLRPHPSGPLDRVHGSYQSVRGPVRAGWERAGCQFTDRVEVPANALASVHVPSAEAGLVRDASGAGPASVAEYPGLRDASEAVFEVGPGRHEFSGPDLRAAR